MSNLACALAGRHGERVALCDVQINATLQDLLSEVCVSQTYRNDEAANIEAVYTFPLPLDAVLLDLGVEIAGRKLKACVVEKEQAERQYEDGMAAGDAAIMLEMIEPGLYTMNVGNLAPAETAAIRFRYAMLYRWNGDRLRFFLPTTIAPRYGESPHLAQQAPESSLTVENQFSLNIEVRGALTDAQFHCVSHEVTASKYADKLVLALQQPKAIMDRDFVLNIKSPHAARSFAVCGVDGDGVAAIASFQPFFPGVRRPRPLRLAIVIDCSGSMQGDSIAQAKQALDQLLLSLQPQDRVTLIAFGSTTNVLSPRLLPCNKTNVSRARRFANQLDANLGGTEINQALHTAYRALGDEVGPADVFVVTDGEVSDWRPVVAGAKKTAHRIFTVGVGAAVSESFVRNLAEQTGGECELVSPREGMAERVVRHFERMRAPRAKHIELRWPDGARDITPSRIGSVFEGDTLSASARFDSSVTDMKVVLKVETDDGETFTETQQILAEASIPDAADGISTIARLAASARLQDPDESSALETALRYQLVSPWTNCIVVAERPDAEKTDELPLLRKVPQTLAAGWGGTGVLAMRSVRFSVAGARSFSADALPMFMASEGTHNAMTARLSDFLKLMNESWAEFDECGAEFVLARAGLENVVAPLFAAAIAIGLRRDAVAVLVLSELLTDRVMLLLSPDAKRAGAALQENARKVREKLERLCKWAQHLGRSLETAAQLLDPRYVEELRNAVDIARRIGVLLLQIRDAAQSHMQHLESRSSDCGEASIA